ncbi:SDR family oxidoreductase [Aquincola sp. MAHUQ-54]|uniref:SDR family oxidoreductase n=1 Tax=Aquincola agrisoli TaxID=3119538 RepID=A0AAW9QI66_9BURK
MTWAEPSLASKRVLITAGADGIGLEIARAFSGAGARVLVCDVRQENLDRLDADLPGVQGVRADVSSEADVAALFEAVDARLGGLDVLVNNAGIAGPTGGVETLSLADWERTLAVNITGQFLCARLAVPRLRQGRGPSIINLSSAAGHLGMPGRSAYSASKWAVVGFTKSLAIELGGDGIRVNAILPGAVDGPRIRAVIAAKAQALGKPLEEVTRDYTGQAALGRMVTAQDVAHMALFAASDLARNVTGQELAVDGHTQALS